MPQATAPAPQAAPKDSQVRVKTLSRNVHNLFPAETIRKSEDEGGYLAALIKREDPKKLEGVSHQRVLLGERQHPFSMRATSAFKNHNVHHSTCIEAKMQALVGLGHVTDKVKKKLGPLTSNGWSNMLQPLAEDFFQVANSYIEVVWNIARTEILGLHFVAGSSVKVVIENSLYEKHYVQHSDEGERRFAAWGDGLDFYFGKERQLRVPFRGEQRAESGAVSEQMRSAFAASLVKSDTTFSELIHISDASSQSRFYGYPSWISAVASIELVQALMQHQFDFHMNRGVPEFMLFMLGAKIGDQEWEAIEDSINRNIGVGNSHKSMAVNLDDPDIEVQLEKLAMERTEDGRHFKDMMETLALNIVSAHRVPPILAGILIPGKLGATNETPNAILAFQALVIGPAQETLESIFDNTLGNSKLNGDLDLVPGDFEFKTIVDEIAEQMEKINPMDTLASSREQLPQQAKEGRDLKEGLKKVMTSQERAMEFILAMVDRICKDG